MSRAHPDTAIGNALVTTIRAARASFSPPLLVATYDDNWQRAASKAAMDAKLPCVLVQLDSGTVDRAEVPDAQVVTNVYRLNYLYKLGAAGSHPTQGTDALGELKELFSDDEDFGLPGWAGQAGIEIQACEPVGHGTSEELLEFDLGWAFVLVQVTYTTLLV